MALVDRLSTRVGPHHESLIPLPKDGGRIQLCSHTQEGKGDCKTDAQQSALGRKWAGKHRKDRKRMKSTKAMTTRAFKVLCTKRKGRRERRSRQGFRESLTSKVIHEFTRPDFACVLGNFASYLVLAGASTIVKTEARDNKVMAVGVFKRSGQRKYASQQKSTLWSIPSVFFGNRKLKPLSVD